MAYSYKQNSSGLYEIYDEQKSPTGVVTPVRVATGSKSILGNYGLDAPQAARTSTPSMMQQTYAVGGYGQQNPNAAEQARLAEQDRVKQLELQRQQAIRDRAQQIASSGAGSYALSQYYNSLPDADKPLAAPYLGSNIIPGYQAPTGNVQQTVVTPQGVTQAPTTPVDDQIRALQNVKAMYQDSAYKGNSPEAIAYAAQTGDVTGLLNEQGKPFSDADQAAALAKGTADVSQAYKEAQFKETQDADAALAQKQAEYQKYLIDQGTQFQTEKTTQDQNAADKGVLFSGGRVQKLQQLGDTYQQNTAYKKSQVGADIGNTARNFGYKYGDTAANGLSKYFSLGSQNYNPNVAKGGVSAGGLSSVYNANQGFYGTENKNMQRDAQQRAAALLGNKGNKLIASGYTNLM